MAADLEEFVGQSALFHEWYGLENLPLIFFSPLRWLKEYDAKSGQLHLHDFIPTACVHGTTTYYNQVDEASVAIRTALELSFVTNFTAGEVLAFVWSAIEYSGKKRRIQILESQLEERIESAAKDLGISLTEDIATLIAPIMEKVVIVAMPSASILASADRFFRILYKLCKEKKDTPAKPRHSVLGGMYE